MLHESETVHYCHIHRKPRQPTTHQHPPNYADYLEVKGSGLSHYQLYKCAIDLLPGTTPSLYRIYSLPQTKQDMLEDWVQKALKERYIPLSHFICELLLCGKEKGGILNILLTTGA